MWAGGATGALGVTDTAGPIPKSTGAATRPGGCARYCAWIGVLTLGNSPPAASTATVMTRLTASSGLVVHPRIRIILHSAGDVPFGIPEPEETADVRDRRPWHQDGAARGRWPGSSPHTAGYI